MFPLITPLLKLPNPDQSVGRPEFNPEEPTGDSKLPLLMIGMAFAVEYENRIIGHIAREMTGRNPKRRRTKSGFIISLSQVPRQRLQVFFHSCFASGRKDNVGPA